MATTTVMRASKDQRNRTTLEEGLKLQAYKDTVGIWTIGVGHAATNPIPVRGMLEGAYYEGPPKEGVSITADESERLFNLDLDEAERGASALITSPLLQCQFDAVIDFIHQFGLTRFRESTLLVKINFNPQSPSILDEFVRWNRTNGVRDEAIWRRACRRAIVYNGTPIPQALWRKNGFPFVVDPVSDQIDYSVTPTIWKLIEYGKKAAEPYKFEPDKIKLEAQPDELVLDKPVPPPAAPPKAEAKGPEPAPGIPAQQVPVPSSVSAESVESPGSAGPVKPSPNAPVPGAKEASPAVIQPPPKKIGPPVPIGQQTSAVDATRKSEDWSSGLKPMALSRRFWGLALVMVGRIWMLKSGSSAVLGAVSDPLVMEMFSGFMVMIVGELIQHWGEKKATRGLK